MRELCSRNRTAKSHFIIPTPKTVAIELTCSNPQCRQPLTLPDEMAGQSLQCSRCGALTPAPPRKSAGPLTASSTTTTKRLGQYTLVRKLGEGGMGTVYEAIQASLDRRVALKVLSQRLMKSKLYLERFQREARAAAVLNHPNIVMVYEIGQDQGYHFFTMEYVDGETLQRRLKREGKIPVSEALSILSNVVEALDYAWTHGNIIHRDIKPDNIMLTREGHVKLADMGLAKSTKEDVSLTMDGVGIGTPAYMSPEQGRGAKSVDCRADIYSVGITLFHTITGQRPFSGDTPLAVMMAHAEQPLPDPRKINPDVPESVCELLERMCAKDPAGRYQTPADLLADLEVLMGGSPLPPRGGAALPGVPASGQSLAGLPSQSSDQPALEVEAPASADAQAAMPQAAPKAGLGLPITLMVGVLTVLAIGILAVRESSHAPRSSPPRPSHSAATPPASAKTSGETRALTLDPPQTATQEAPPGSAALEVSVEKPREGRNGENSAHASRVERQTSGRVGKPSQAAVYDAWDKLQKKVEEHLNLNHFGEALVAIDEVPEGLKSEFAPKDLARLKNSITSQAQQCFEVLQMEASERVEAGKFDEARMLYGQASQFGLLPIDEKVEKKLAELDELETAARKQEQDNREEAYQRVYQEALSLSKQRQYEPAAKKLESLQNDSGFKPMTDRIAADIADLQKAKAVLDEALQALRGQVGRPVALKGMNGNLQSIKEGHVILSSGGAEFPVPVASLPARELANLAAPALNKRGGEGSLCLALFWSCEGEPSKAAQALEKARAAGIDTLPYEAKIGGAETADVAEARQPEEEGTPELDDGVGGGEKMPREESDQRQELIKMVRSIEKDLVRENNEKWNGVLKNLEYQFKLKDQWDDPSPTIRWQRFAESYERNRRSFDKYYYQARASYAAAKEKYEFDVMNSRKAKKNAYERIHGNALKLIQRIKEGKEAELDSEAIREIVVERSGLGS